MFSSFIAFNNKDFAMKRLLVLFFAVLPCFSFAACWESIYLDNEAKDNVFIDLCGISGKDIKTFWVKRTYQKQKELEGYLYKKYDSVKSLESVDCKNNKILSNEAYYYLGDDTTHSWRNNTKTYQNIIPDSVGENIKNTACNIEDFRQRVLFFSPFTESNNCLSKEKYITNTNIFGYNHCTLKKYKNLRRFEAVELIRQDDIAKTLGFNSSKITIIFDCSDFKYHYEQEARYKRNENEALEFVQMADLKDGFNYDEDLAIFFYKEMCLKKPIYKNK